jgi:zinc transporter ZupT
MILLALAILSLFLGPVLGRASDKAPWLHAFFDGFVLFSILSLTLLYVIPNGFEKAGPLAMLFIALGLFFPTALERTRHKLAENAHNLALIFGLIGISLHGFIDGVALIKHDNSTVNFALPFSVILHRLPEGLSIWWLLFPKLGTKKTIFVFFGNHTSHNHWVFVLGLTAHNN